MMAARRLALVVPLMWLVSVLAFLLIHLSPVDPAVLLAGDHANEADVEAIRAGLGLEASLVRSYLAWITRVLHGDLGLSVFSGMPVSELILQRLGPSAALACWSLLLAVLIALPLGMLAAYRRHGWIERAILAWAALGVATPSFVLAFLLVSCFAIAWPLLPAQGYVSLAESPLLHLRSLVLPAATLALALAAPLTRMTRASMLAVLGQDHIKTARAKGLSATRVLLNHGLRNAALPVVTSIASSFTVLVGGVVVVESVFALPGLGRLTMDAVLRHDYAVVQAAVLLSALACILINLLTDLGCQLMDPRL